MNTGRFALYELLPDNEGSPVAVPYAKLKEVEDLSGVVTTLSGNVYAKIEESKTELANKIGNADQAAAEGGYDLIINNSVLSQLKRIYGDLTSITSDITTLSGNVDTLNTFQVTLQNGDVAGLKYIETYWGTSSDFKEIENIKYSQVEVESVGVDNYIGGIDGIGAFNTKNLEVGQYIHTLKIPGDFQIVATYVTETVVQDNQENQELRLVYPDVVYSENANYISILSDDDKVPGLPWKFFITKKIL